MPGEARGEGWHFPAPASGPLLGTCPLGGAGAGLDPTSSGRRHSNSLGLLSPREVRDLAWGGRKSEHIPKGHIVARIQTQIHLEPKPEMLHEAASILLLPFLIPSPLFN